MGCDIHLYVEKKYFKYDDEEKKNGTWVNKDKWTQNYYATLYPEESEDEWEIDYDNAFYSGRNYDLFAILADVRNGYGFAGSYTGEGFVSICEPKGFPEDASNLVKKEYERWQDDGHSHSWLTLKELNEYDWNQETYVLKPGIYKWGEQTKDKTMKATYKDCVGKFYTETLQKLKNLLSKDESEENVRIVFWFDN